MSEKKNIDRLFQEKFKDFEANPPEMVWDDIETELKKKQKRRVIPLWFKMSGVAALLLIGLLLINPFDTEVDTANPVVNSDTNTTVPENHEPGKDILIENRDIPNMPAQEAVVSNEGNLETGTVNDGTQKINRANTGIKNNSIVTNNSNLKSTDRLNNSIANTTADETVKLKNSRSENGIAATDAVHENKANSNIIVQPGKVADDRESLPPAAVRGDESALAANDKKVNSENAIPENKVADKDKVTTENDEAIAATAIDSTSTDRGENELEKLLQEKLNGKDEEDSKIAEQAPMQKWNIKPQMAPVFYNSLSNGSPIDEQFAGNAKDYDNNMSYGVGVNYAVNDRITIRSGVNTLNLSYATRGVEFFPSMSKQTNNISATAARSANFVVQNQSPENAIPGVSAMSASQVFKGSLVQEMGYIEVPVEMSYALFTKKFSVDVIGGFSTLFLNDNNVSVVTTQGYASTLGEADNVNTVNFSTNIGVGFRYRFLKSFQASFEPMFKYQVNTFSGNSGNFKPYFIGLYSGVSFSF